nr:hypothetical protein CFP56_51465 [Quercus suber]
MLCQVSSKGCTSTGVIHMCIKKGIEFYAIVPNFSIKPPRTQIQVKWLKPNPGWVKLNSDGPLPPFPAQFQLHQSQGTQKKI